MPSRKSEQQEEIEKALIEGRYPQIYDGAWFSPHMSTFRNQCCDCGLVHDIAFKKLKRGMRMRVKVNRRATVAVRRAFKFEKDDNDA